ncbi:protein-histidine N-methyltransferase NDAI_0B03680 [Naumovozyma dairenensis CBS 421]|uniref:protein-histidine N-methyltransferase n=1 Tax=Naumovozyma dairenensis (strain ATCC 10597 / BCRC 20456 / CBS 421 / NBRC 0211 / NRRL Y-12639) TaxID=1071378 RepID=G0W6J1_NAUDC|nr:hypothetical protein NDAI_0B03680 [Naumovozyma dairenensis CBS 421]CCD23402.1 hypothetical protein NDAI_0B03680 [Naumovozyma dairenensis CBS 421]
MSFSFGFTSNDLNDDELTDDETIAPTGSTQTTNEFVNPLDFPRLLTQDVVQPQIIDLSLMLKSLNNVRLSFEQFSSPITSYPLYRRELFDVKHQLMLESDDPNVSNTNNELTDILIGDTSEDLRKNVYEGGLKSWECSIDLVDALNDTSYKELNQFNTFVELGCGTSLPTEFIFSKLLLESTNQDITKTVILSDYNESVLRLVSLPNLLITWANCVLTAEQRVSLQRAQDENVPICEDELLLTEKLLDSFYQDMQKRNINIHFISGSWGRTFTKLLHTIIPADQNILVLTSETIYQPENLPVIAETLLDLKLSYSSIAVKEFVAAKDIYFGVGGSIVEFENYLKRK